MRIIKRKRYYFSDSSIASDTVIAYILGGLSFITEVAGVITSIATKGHIPDIFALLYLCAVILSVVGIFFASLGKKAQEGGEKGKRFSVALNIVTLIIPFAIVIAGQIGG